MGHLPAYTGLVQGLRTWYNDTMRKLTLHLQSVPSWIPEFVRRSGVEWIKWIDPPEQRPDWCQGINVIGRTYEPDQDSNNRIWNGVEGARSWFAKWHPFYLARPWVHCWESTNEPHPMSDPLFRARLNEFTVELARLMHNYGLRLVGMNWSVGWPDIGTAAEMGEGVQACDYLGLHEYSAPQMQQDQGFLCLRYRRTAQELADAGYQVPPILVTECGIDGGVIGQPKTGWRTFCDQFSCYLDQLKWYSGELEGDNVQAATIFTVCDWDWRDFAIEEPEAMSLADWIASDEPAPQRARGIDVSQWQGTINWQAVYDSDIRFAFIRASVGDRTDPNWETNYAGARAAGLLVGAYHYIEPFTDSQAGTFARAVRGKVLELGCWADIEHDELTAAKCANFFTYADPQIEQPIGIYTSASKFNKYGTPDWAAGRKLWVAHWGADEPTLPDAWDAWEFWQQTSDGSVPGIVGRVDLDVYAGTLKQLYSAYGNQEEPVSDVKVFDITGQQKDWAWVVEQYGPLDIREAEPWKQADGSMQVLRLVELRENFGPATCIAKFLKEDGTPLVGKNAAWWYSTAPMLPDGINPPTSVWEPRADVGQTNGEGIIGFAMSEDGTYYPDQGVAGPYGTWLFSTTWSCDGYFGIGLKAGTDHGHLDPVFQVVTVEDGGEEPEPEDLSAIVEVLERIAVALEKVAGLFA